MLASAQIAWRERGETIMSLDCAGDEELMAKVAIGNREAMTPLLRRYASPLLTFIQRMVGDRHRAEEVFQDVFLAVWKNRRQYEFPRAFKSWLFGIAANKCRGDFRKPGTPLALLRLTPSRRTAARAIRRSRRPSRRKRRRWSRREWPRCRRSSATVLVLRIWNGQEYSEIAAALGRAESTIRSDMFHALAAMRRYLEPRLRQPRET